MVRFHDYGHDYSTTELPGKTLERALVQVISFRIQDIANKVEDTTLALS